MARSLQAAVVDPASMRLSADFCGLKSKGCHIEHECAECRRYTIVLHLVGKEDQLGCGAALACSVAPVAQVLSYVLVA